MSKAAIVAGLVVAVATLGCGRQSPEEPVAQSTPAPEQARTAMARLQFAEGIAGEGTVTFTETPQGVQVAVHLTGVNPGRHGIHLHENGECELPDFESAGDHFAPEGHPHGGPQSPQHHAGDFGNIEVGDDGVGHLELTSTTLTLDDGPNSAMGRAVVLHADEDDLTSQPAGNSGARIACGVVEADTRGATAMPAS
jgi:superoxide dismutase, Cu-Zn family